MMGAGGSLEPFWELYPQHQKAEVFQLLEKYRIGKKILVSVVMSNNKFLP